MERLFDLPFLGHEFRGSAKTWKAGLVKADTSMEAMRRKRVAIHGLIGAGVFGVAQVLLFWRIDPFLSWFYVCAWWSYILVVDSLIHRMKGDSLILSRTREFFLMVCWSFTIWLFFETVNLVMTNWYYINVPQSRLVRLFGYAVSYGTVLPAIFETAELLETLGLFRHTSAPKITVTRSWIWVLFATGILFLILPLVLPQYTFPLIWGSLIFLLEPINYRFGGKSLLAEWERGSLRKFYILLVSGIICGGLWEFWNFWARTKWVYTVPFFDELKLFEMPVLGFLGFPPFAVECYIIYNFISLFRFNRSWEEDSYRIGGKKKTSLALRLITIVAIVVFYGVSTRGIDRHTIHSTIAVLEDIPDFTAEEIEVLNELGIHTADDLVYETRTPGAYDRIRATVNLPSDRLAELIQQARLIDLKGLGIDHFLLLQNVGIDSVEGLAKQTPEALYEKLQVVQPSCSPGRPPTRAQIKIWIMAARR
jgi:hypothetical protein